MRWVGWARERVGWCWGKGRGSVYSPAVDLACWCPPQVAPEAAGNRRKLPPETAGNRREPPENAGNRRKPPETAGSHGKNMPPETAGTRRRKPPETAGTRRQLLLKLIALLTFISTRMTSKPDDHNTSRATYDLARCSDFCAKHRFKIMHHIQESPSKGSGTHSLPHYPTKNTPSTAPHQPPPPP